MKKDAFINPSEERLVFLAKAHPITILFSYLMLLFLLVLIGGRFYSHFSGAEDDFFTLLKVVIFDWRIWLILAPFVLLFLNIHFRSVEFLENIIVIKKWYSRTTYYRYDEISKISRDIEEGSEGIIIFFPMEKKSKFPHIF